MNFKILQTQNAFYKLKFGFSAMEFVEEMLGISITELETALSKPSMKQIRILLHGMLECGEGRKFKVDEVHQIMDVVVGEQGLDGLASLVGEVVSLAFPQSSHPEEVAQGKK